MPRVVHASMTKNTNRGNKKRINVSRVTAGRRKPVIKVSKKLK